MTMSGEMKPNVGDGRFLDYAKSSRLDHSHVNDYSKKSYSEFLDSKAQMRDFANTRKKVIKQRKVKD